MGGDSSRNRAAWEAASDKHVREYQELLAQARNQSSLVASELDLLRPILSSAPTVVHLQSGHGLDDIALVRAGARSVLGVDFSQVAATSAQRRADELGVACRYVVAELPGAPLRDGCADLVYTGKGALIWLTDLRAWAADVARLLRPSGQLFVHEAHPAVPLWTWDEDKPRIRPDRGYFARSHVNDTFPARGAVESQATLAEIINAVLSAGLELRHVAEYAEPFWRPDGVSAAAWQGQLPNAFALLAQRKDPAQQKDPTARAVGRGAETPKDGAKVRSRTNGMWWGTAVEAPDPGALARFYAELLGWTIGHKEPGTTILAAPGGASYVVFQQATGYQAPVWPPVDGRQRPMMHFDFQVGDLDSAVAEAVALGASVAPDQPRDNVRVLFDPAGHPFCLCRDDDGDDD